MATARRHRSRTSQPELPLPVPDRVAAGERAGGTPATDWRLDERTRLVGLQGIAAARARLAAPPDPIGGRSEADDHRQAGRAA